tara:strand:+ start:9670 stop:10287 length:618 start_codon:yes stop_codon:yes gene_type:complete
MFTLQRLLVAILAAVAGASLYAQTDWLEAAKSARQLPTETFIGSPDVRQPRLSPDGSKIALLFPHEGKMALGLFDRKKGSAEMILQATDESLFSFFWKGNERLVFTADYQGNESFFVGSTNLKGKRVIRIVETQRYERLTGGGQVVFRVVCGTMKIVSWYRGPFVRPVFLIGLPSRMVPWWPGSMCAIAGFHRSIELIGECVTRT